MTAPTSSLLHELASRSGSGSIHSLVPSKANASPLPCYNQTCVGDTKPLPSISSLRGSDGGNSSSGNTAHGGNLGSIIFQHLRRNLSPHWNLHQNKPMANDAPKPSGLLVCVEEDDDEARDDQGDPRGGDIPGGPRAGLDDDGDEASRDLLPDEAGYGVFPGQVWQEFIRDKYRLIAGPEVESNRNSATADRKQLLIRRGLGVCIGMHSGLWPPSLSSSPLSEGVEDHDDNPSLHDTTSLSFPRGGICPSAVRGIGALGLLRIGSDKNRINARYQGDILTSARSICHAAYPGQV